MDKIVGVIGSVPDVKSRNDDDFSDRLNHRYTSALMVFFAVVVSTKQYVGDPINCWVPAHFSGAWEEYANSYCWIKNTYYLPFEEHIPHEHEEDQRDIIPYYQWVPIILLVQALLFFMPIMIWRTLNSRSGIDVNNIVEAAETFENTEKAEDREKTLGYMARQMDRYLKSQQEYKTSCTISLKHCLSRTCCAVCGRRFGNYLVVLYIFTKVLFIVNVIGQLFVLNAFLGTEFHLYGIEVIRSLIEGIDWTQSSRFPRVTMCDFKVRRLGNVQRYTVQCVLPINLFNEKIYLFIWFWMVFLAVLACYSLLSWVVKMAMPNDSERYIKKHLALLDKIKLNPKDNKEREEQENNIKNFTHKYLHQDGVFVLRLIGANTNAITVTEVVCQLWENYLKDPDDKPKISEGEHAV